jgi:phage shock protein PspC (stress-responsive transcriptional regulator)
MTEPRKLAKNLTDRMLSGVCAGLADYFNIDRNLVRLLAVVLTVITTGAVVLAYILAAFLLPVREEDRAKGHRTSLLSIVFMVILLGAMFALFSQ